MMPLRDGGPPTDGGGLCMSWDRDGNVDGEIMVYATTRVERVEWSAGNDQINESIPSFLPSFVRSVARQISSFGNRRPGLSDVSVCGHSDYPALRSNPKKSCFPFLFAARGCGAAGMGAPLFFFFFFLLLLPCPFPFLYSWKAIRSSSVECKHTELNKLIHERFGSITGHETGCEHNHSPPCRKFLPTTMAQWLHRSRPSLSMDIHISAT